MARGTTLGILLQELRLHAGMDPNPALSLNMVPLMRMRLREEQERLYDDFSWPFLRIMVDVPTQAGERYYDIPSEMNLERIELVEVKWGGKWTPLDRGVGSDQYNAYDSDLGLGVDPARRWDVTDTGAGPQIEIWPMPITDGLPLRFTGIRKLAPLQEDGDRADLDDQVIAMFVAAEFIDDEKKASEKRSKAVSRLHTLRGLVTRSRGNKFNMNREGGDSSAGRPAPLVAYVRAP